MAKIILITIGGQGQRVQASNFEIIKMDSAPGKQEMIALLKKRLSEPRNTR